MRSWPPIPAGRLAWSPATRTRLAAILEATLPPSELGGDPAHLPDFLGGFVATLATGRRLGIRVLLEALYWLAPLLLLGRLASFGGLTPDAREVVLARLATSRAYPLRMGATALKSLAGLAVLGDPRVRARLELDGGVPLPPTVDTVRWHEDIEGVGRP